MSSFLNFNWWVHVKVSHDPLPVAIERMQVFFWVKRRVYLKVINEIKNNLKIRWDPEKKEPMKGSYIIKHGHVRGKNGEYIPITQYRGSGVLYKRHALKR